MLTTTRAKDEKNKNKNNCDLNMHDFQSTTDEKISLK